MRNDDYEDDVEFMSQAVGCLMGILFVIVAIGAIFGWVFEGCDKVFDNVGKELKQTRWSPYIPFFWMNVVITATAIGVIKSLQANLSSISRSLLSIIMGFVIGGILLMAFLGVLRLELVGSLIPVWIYIAIFFIISVILLSFSVEITGNPLLDASLPSALYIAMVILTTTGLYGIMNGFVRFPFIAYLIVSGTMSLIIVAILFVIYG